MHTPLNKPRSAACHVAPWHPSQPVFTTCVPNPAPTRLCLPDLPCAALSRLFCLCSLSLPSPCFNPHDAQPTEIVAFSDRMKEFEAINCNVGRRSCAFKCWRLVVGGSRHFEGGVVNGVEQPADHWTGVSNERQQVSETHTQGCMGYTLTAPNLSFLLSCCFVDAMCCRL